MMMAKILPAGKLSHELLDSLLKRYTSADRSVAAGAATGIDAAILRHSGPLLFAKTDPVTLVTMDLGYYVVNINANDIASMGGKPKWFMVTLLFPADGTNRRIVESVFSGIREACDALRVSFCGGHTELTDAVTRVVAVGAMLGPAMTKRTFQTSRAMAGDVLVLTKGIAIEGSSIIARERRGEVLEMWGEDFWARCMGFLRDPGIGVVPEARIAARIPGVHAMHDPTEGGLATALHELADAAGVGFIIRRDKIPVLPETDLLCRRYGINPLGLIASGALLVAVGVRQAERLVAALSKGGVKSAVIGRLVEDPRQRSIVIRGRRYRLRRFDRDEILKVGRWH